jgi:hypothetical protein
MTLALRLKVGDENGFGIRVLSVVLLRRSMNRKPVKNAIFFSIIDFVGVMDRTPSCQIT